MKKRVLVWAYFTKNAGDDLFLKILFDRYSNVEWDLLTANRNYKRVFQNYKNVNIIYTYREICIGKYKLNPFFILNNLILKFKKYDALVNIGGSIFKQNKAWLSRICEREYLLTNFKKLNKKAFIIGANFGPFDDSEFIDKYKRIFPKYDDICFRDNYSYNLFSNLKNVRIAPDVVFTLGIKPPTNPEKIVGFSLIDIEKREGLNQYYEKYNLKMIELMDLYLKKGYRVKLFSFCEYEGDLRISNMIAKNDRFKDREVEIISYNGNLERFLEQFKSCEIIIGTRFHSIILALNFNQKVYPIIYSDKTYHVLKDLKLEDHCCYINDIENLFFERITASTTHTKIDSSKVIFAADRQFEKLDLFLGKCKNKTYSNEPLLIIT